MVVVAWTTVSNRDEADRLARGSVENRLAACAQIGGPIASHYRWHGKIESEEEYRVTFKCLEENLPSLESWILKNHSYQTPQWLSVKAEGSKDYLQWMKEC